MLLMALNRLIFLGMIGAILTLVFQEKIGEALLLGALLLPLTTLSGLASFANHLLSMFSSPLSGILSDRLGDRWRLILFALLLGSASLALAARAEGLLVIACILPGAITTSILMTQTTALVGDLVPHARQPRVLGLFSTLGDLGSATGPLLAFALIAAGWPLAQGVAARGNPDGAYAALDCFCRVERAQNTRLALNWRQRLTRVILCKYYLRGACASPQT